MNIKKRKLGKWLILPLCLIFTVACEKVQFEPVVIPDTDLSFETDIQPILTAKCVECHPPSKSLDFNPAFAYDAIVPEFATEADSANPQGSKFYQKLAGSSHAPRTSDVEKQKFLKWISQGVPNN
jgi:hypothetical protein